jgi:hypothetical protein
MTEYVRISENRRNEKREKDNGTYMHKEKDG